MRQVEIKSMTRRTFSAEASIPEKGYNECGLNNFSEVIS